MFGILLIPHIAERLEDGMAIPLQLIEQAFSINIAIEQMNEAEKTSYRHYSYREIFNGAYSREKTVSRFLHKLFKILRK